MRRKKVTAVTEVPDVEPSKVDERVVGAVSADEQAHVHVTASEWLGMPIIDRNGERLGKLRDVYVDVETDVPQFGTVKEGVFTHHLTFVPLAGVQVSPDHIQITATKDQIRTAPNMELQGGELSQADEKTLYHHFEQNYTPIKSESGRRLARR